MYRIVTREDTIRIPAEYIRRGRKLEEHIDELAHEAFEGRFDENEHTINIFFDRKTLNLIGWQNIDIYQNLVITYLFDIEINSQLEKDQFKLPSIN